MVAAICGDIELMLPEFEREVGKKAFAAAWDEGKGLDFDSAVGRLRVSIEAVTANG